MVSAEEIVTRLRELLGDVDLEKTSERMLRTKLEEEFGEDLSDQKDLIGKEILEYLNAAGGEPEEGGDDNDGVVKKEEDDVEEEEDDEGETPRAGSKRKAKRGGGSVLSQELQDFLGVDSMPRAQIVKFIFDYIKTNELRDKDEEDTINLDEKLETLFTAPLDSNSLNKQLSKHITTAAQAKKKAKKSEGGSGGRKKGSGFTKPIKVSTELADLLGKNEISRPELTKFMWAYFKSNGLQDPNNKRHILCDEKLKALTNVDRFNGFGFMKVLKHHIVQD